MKAMHGFLYQQHGCYAVGKTAVRLAPEQRHLYSERDEVAHAAQIKK
jgi:hypothetical protein